MFCKWLCLLLLFRQKNVKVAGNDVSSNITGTNSWQIEHNKIVQRRMRQGAAETPVDKGELPYHVSIQKVQKKDGDLKKAIHICEGAIITERTVITSSVCRFQNYKFKDDVFDFYAAAGFASDKDEKTMKKIRDMCMRKRSSIMSSYDDQHKEDAVLSLSLVILEEKFEFKPNAIGPIDLENITPGEEVKCKLSAFKLKDNQYIDRLFRVDAQTMKCRTIHQSARTGKNFNNETEYLARIGTGEKRRRKKYKKWKIICTAAVPFRIEGGPLVCNNKLVGVSYQNSPEGGNNTELYLSVGAQNQWINKNVNRARGSDDSICDLHTDRLYIREDKDDFKFKNVLIATLIATGCFCFITIFIIISLAVYVCWHRSHAHQTQPPSNH